MGVIGPNHFNSKIARRYKLPQKRNTPIVQKRYVNLLKALRL